MRPDELVALGDAAGEALTSVSTQVRAMHQGIAQRVWRSAGPAAAPVRLVHDGIATGVYTAVERSLGTLVRTGARALSLGRRADAPSLESSPRARQALGALNGAFGDTLEQRGNRLALPMTLRLHGADVAPDRGSLVRACPAATERLAVFVHGLCQTEEAWGLGATRHPPYGTRLQAELGYTPLYVRYNSGRHVSANGRALGSLLAEVVRSWPVEVSEIALIGHSMGGLVARSACHYHGGSDWAGRVRHVFTLGSPHRGMPLELVACAACAALSRLPETRALGDAINRRSAGIKDLGRGYLVDEDWREHDPEAFLARTGREIPFLRSANHYFLSAGVGRAADGPLGKVVGDLLVLRASAWAHGGAGERLRFPVDRYVHVAGAHHFDLLNHPAVYEQIRRWLGGLPALPPPRALLPAGS